MASNISEISSDTIMSEVLNDTNAILISDKKRGRPEDTVWEHMNKTRLSDGHSKAHNISEADLQETIYEITEAMLNNSDFFDSNEENFDDNEDLIENLVEESTNNYNNELEIASIINLNISDFNENNSEDNNILQKEEINH
ncbi:3064_t:CDS:2, partial [Acaulospora morrowiae]